MTYVFNEAVNLPIWVNYYGKLFGFENLFVVDTSSNDGSTDNLGAVNVIRIPKKPFDEDEKTNFLSSFHASLTTAYDAVIATDCDEIMIPDPAKYSDLNDYISRLSSDYVNAVGIDLVHLISEEPPLDLSKPILSQRRYGLFSSPECKPLLSRVPVKWLPGLHASDKEPKFDTDLYLFHLKLMDFTTSTNRHQLNRRNDWSGKSLERNYGAHHRYSLKQFIMENFFSLVDRRNRGELTQFGFGPEIKVMVERTVIDPEGNYRPPMDVPAKFVQIPERFAQIV